MDQSKPSLDVPENTKKDDTDSSTYKVTISLAEEENQTSGKSPAQSEDQSSRERSDESEENQSSSVKTISGKCDQGIDQALTQTTDNTSLEKESTCEKKETTGVSGKKQGKTMSDNQKSPGDDSPETVTSEKQTSEQKEAIDESDKKQGKTTGNQRSPDDDDSPETVTSEKPTSEQKESTDVSDKKQGKTMSDNQKSPDDDDSPETVTSENQTSEQKNTSDTAPQSGSTADAAETEAGETSKKDFIYLSSSKRSKKDDDLFEVSFQAGTKTGNSSAAAQSETPQKDHDNYARSNSNKPETPDKGSNMTVDVTKLQKIKTASGDTIDKLSMILPDGSAVFKSANTGKLYHLMKIPQGPIPDKLQQGINDGIKLGKEYALMPLKITQKVPTSKVIVTPPVALSSSTLTEIQKPKKVRKCDVKNCPNNSYMFPHLRFFKGPKSEPLFSVWCTRIGRPDLIEKGSMRHVCDAHFESKHYTASGTRLLRDAVPTVQLPSTGSGPIGSRPRTVEIHHPVQQKRQTMQEDIAAPVFMEQLQDVVLPKLCTQNKNRTLSCVVKVSPLSTLYVTWYHNGEKIQACEHYKPNYEREPTNKVISKISLTIFAPSASDAGIFVCEIGNEKGKTMSACCVSFDGYNAEKKHPMLNQECSKCNKNVEPTRQGPDLLADLFKKAKQEITCMKEPNAGGKKTGIKFIRNVTIECETRRSTKKNVLTMSCIVNNPDVTLRWFKNGRKIKRCKHFEMVICKNPSSKFSLLRVEPMEGSDGGIYTCLASDAKHRRATTSRYLSSENRVSELQIVPLKRCVKCQLSSKSTLEGSTLRNILTGNVSTTPPRAAPPVPRATASSQPQLTDHYYNYRATSKSAKSGQSYLSLHKQQQRSQKELDQLIKEIKPILDMKVPEIQPEPLTRPSFDDDTKPVFFKRLSDQAVRGVVTNERSVTFKCELNVSSAKHEWFHNGRRIIPCEDYKVGRGLDKEDMHNEAMLKILSVKKEDIGVYTCIASNGAGSLSTSAFLSIPSEEYSWPTYSCDLCASEPRIITQEKETGNPDNSGSSTAGKSTQGSKVSDSAQVMESRTSIDTDKEMDTTSESPEIPSTKESEKSDTTEDMEGVESGNGSKEGETGNTSESPEEMPGTKESDSAEAMDDVESENGKKDSASSSSKKDPITTSAKLHELAFKYNRLGPMAVKEELKGTKDPESKAIILSCQFNQHENIDIKWLFLGLEIKNCRHRRVEKKIGPDEELIVSLTLSTLRVMDMGIYTCVASRYATTISTSCNLTAKGRFLTEYLKSCDKCIIRKSDFVRKRKQAGDLIRDFKRMKSCKQDVLCGDKFVATGKATGWKETETSDSGLSLDIINSIQEINEAQQTSRTLLEINQLDDQKTQLIKQLAAQNGKLRDYVRTSNAKHGKTTKTLNRKIRRMTQKYVTPKGHYKYHKATQTLDANDPQKELVKLQKRNKDLTKRVEEIAVRLTAARRQNGTLKRTAETQSKRRMELEERVEELEVALQRHQPLVYDQFGRPITSS